MVEYVVYNNKKTLYEGNNLDHATEIFERTAPSQMQVSSFDLENDTLTISEHVNWSGRTRVVGSERYTGARLRALERILIER